MQFFRPGDQDEARDIVAWAAQDKVPLAIKGAGSKAGLGYAVEAAHGLDLSGLAGILEYEPSELFLTARAGTPLSEIARLLDEHDQMLAFEPHGWQGLLAGDIGAGPTIGGVIACNIAGPRRLTAGAARDHFLGFAGINGRGEAYKAGAKVVKNVTGYDLCKLMAGSMGTLTVLTEITVKVLPRPETSCTLAASGLDDRAALALLAEALNGPNEVTAAAHLPAAAAARSAVAAVAAVAVAATAQAGRAVTALRLEGPVPSVEFRRGEVEALLRRAGAEPLYLSHADSLAFWQDVGRGGCLLPSLSPDTALWRICTAPSQAAAVAEAAGAVDHFYDWAGGLLWLATDAPGGAAGPIRDAVARYGGHATLMRAPSPLREEVQPFQPVPAALDALHARVKQGFDPLGILNPGRMQRGL
ncbi:MAG TPA: glycolate oxidase subunit GlcE [Stellaceae bacterium]|nr:glycolate oxidase subunit GlcE [Stellaceae bacterium]